MACDIKDMLFLCDGNQDVGDLVNITKMMKAAEYSFLFRRGAEAVFYFFSFIFSFIFYQLLNYLFIYYSIILLINFLIYFIDSLIIYPDLFIST